MVVVGVGNVLLADDAAGVRVVDMLRDRRTRSSAALPAGTELIDGGTLGVELAGMLRGSRGLVIADGVRLGGPAGAISVHRGDDVAVGGRAQDGSPADAVGELLAVARLMGWLPDEVSLVGIEVGDLGPGVWLTTAVEAAIPRAADAVVEELDRIEARTRGRSCGGDAARMAGALA